MSGAIGAMVEDMTRTATGACFFESMVPNPQTLTEMDLSKQNPTAKHSPPCPMVTPDTAHAKTVMSNHRNPPTSNAYKLVVDMYMDWVGEYRDERSLRDLFTNSEWRCDKCKKNSAALKRMQRLSGICGAIENHLESVGMVGGHSAEDVAAEIIRMEKIVFHDELPTSFAWTRYFDKYTKYTASNIH